MFEASLQLKMIVILAVLECVQHVLHGWIHMQVEKGHLSRLKLLNYVIIFYKSTRFSLRKAYLCFDVHFKERNDEIFN